MFGFACIIIITPDFYGSAALYKARRCRKSIIRRCAAKLLPLAIWQDW